MHGWGMGMGMGMLIWFAVGFVLIVLLVWAIGRAAIGGVQRDSAEAILRDRFARGEITREEFEEKLAALRR